MRKPTETVATWNGLEFRYMRLSRSPDQNFVVGEARMVLRAPVVLWLSEQGQRAPAVVQRRGSMRASADATRARFAHE